MVKNDMNKIFTSCNSPFIFIFIIFFLTACGGDKQPPTTADKSDAPVSTSEQVQAKPEETQAESSVEPAPTPKVEVAKTQTTPVPAKSTQEQTPAPTGTIPQQDDMLALAKKSGCMACHAIDKKIVGPAWKDVAKRYAGNSGAREQLIEKVSKGGKGNWTDVVGSATMPPYYPRVTKENIGKLVDFVLSMPN